MQRFLLAACLIGVPSPLFAGTVELVAGTGKPGYTGDGGPAAKAQLNQPFHVAFDSAGNLLILESGNNCIRKVDKKTGVITTIVGTGNKGHTGDGGPATAATLNDPHALDVDKNDDIYIADRMNFAIRKVDGKTGVITTVAGTGKKGSSKDGGPAAESALVEPDDCFLDGKGGLLIADVGDWKIRRVDLKTGIISTFAGTGKPKGKIDRKQIGDGGPATKAIVVGARAVCADRKGNVFICEREGNSIRKVDQEGIISTVAGTGEKGFEEGPLGKLNGPKAIRSESSNHWDFLLLIADTENHAIRLLSQKVRGDSVLVSTSGGVFTIAGGKEGSNLDPDPLKTGLRRPHGCLMAADGTLYIADSENHRVLRVKP